MYIRNQLNEESCNACAICSSLENSYNLEKLCEKSFYRKIRAVVNSSKINIEDSIKVAKVYGINVENSKYFYKVTNSIGLGNSNDIILAIKRSWAIVISLHIGLFDRIKTNNIFVNKGFSRHSVSLVEYDELEENFVIQNSWGIEWGVHGCCRIPRKFIDDKKFFISSYGLILDKEKRNRG